MTGFRRESQQPVFAAGPAAGQAQAQRTGPGRRPPPPGQGPECELLVKGAHPGSRGAPCRAGQEARALGAEAPPDAGEAAARQKTRGPRGGPGDTEATRKPAH